MTHPSTDAERDQGATRAQSAAAAAPGADASTTPHDAVPLSEGAVRNGGAYTGGDAPVGDAESDPAEPRNPLDSREHFGGDGASYVAPDGD